MSKLKREQPAELDDNSTIAGIANYSAGQIVIDDEDPSMRYYFAAKDDVENRPDGVNACLRMGYKISEKKSYGAPDSVLMEIPREIYEKREREKHKMNLRRQASTINPSSPENHGLSQLPGYDHGSRDLGGG